MDTASGQDRRPRRIDAVIVVCVLGLGTIDLLFPIESSRSDGGRPTDFFHVLLVVAMVLPLFARRTRPVATMAAVSVLWGIDRLFVYPDTIAQLSLLVGMYSIGRYVERSRALRIGPATALVLLLFTLAGVLRGDAGLGYLTILFFAVFLLAPFFLGIQIRVSTEYRRELEERNAYLEEAREREAQQAVMEERARIARELHDVVAHKMSVVVLQASGARRIADRDPALVIEALGAIETAGRDGLAEMRRLLDVMRTEDTKPDTAPQPGLDQLEALVSGIEAAGLQVRLEIKGDRDTIPAGVDLNAYRIIQEALTNSLRHAGPAATAAVSVSISQTAVDIEVVDDGRGIVDTLISDNGGGHGLLNMRERAAMFGGAFSAGPKGGGGYRVRATLPLPI